MESEYFELSNTPCSYASSIPIERFGLDLDSSSCHYDAGCCDTLPINSSEVLIPDGNHHIRHALQELETALMAADDDDQLTTSCTSGSSTPQFPQYSPQSDFQFCHSNLELHAAMDSASATNLKHLLIQCAQALSQNNLREFQKLVELVRGSVSISGEPLQRVGAYMLEGLVARKENFGSNLYQAINCRVPITKDHLSYMLALYEACPFWKFSYMAANCAIAEACKNEDRIHIIDFRIRRGTRWMTLLQALAKRPSGAPRVRITGIDDPVSRFAREGGLAAIRERYSEISKRLNIPIEFHGVAAFARDITREMLDVRPGEALAVIFPQLLNSTPDERMEVWNSRDGLIWMVKSLSPKVVTLVEQESNTNTDAFVPRFVEALDYYSAMFESIDVGMPRDRKDRIDVEQLYFGREIVNVIACEGEERVERHEVFGKWRSRFMMAGFEQMHVGPYVNSVVRGLLKGYSQHYTLVEKDGAMFLGWKYRNLISASAWLSRF